MLKEDRIFTCITTPNEIELKNDLQKSLNKQIDDIFCDTLMIKNENEKVKDLLKDKNAKQIMNYVIESIEKTRIQRKFDKVIDSVIGTRTLLNEKHDSIKKLFRCTYDKANSFKERDKYGLIVSRILFEYRLKDRNLPFPKERFKKLLIKEIYIVGSIANRLCDIS
ncbi:hypothetical protein Kpol_1036p102 [Vanderwaltozyma polyspora DSM 70294]|uniref:Uncharacterized protein n=1 Tax=Vanderwaltozyma polyspora (strain ATCC 22028 / DSM 70294 / BCRC 21397 / CBS 2163 / NBRC 10782 / NRRL Y-8283 / UCD 57-17) TaxID=436907 RepID=A7TEP7_VANPO|nr:uncharacterized protein Kpol_1036p102 [Vanderwaltozyma polyspora DSM 70294]EDO19354.1 hypothetical protein Kpol_1036p102 [Vanderwaltozyma polyspora DSM 70294]